MIPSHFVMHARAVIGHVTVDRVVGTRFIASAADLSAVIQIAPFVIQMISRDKSQVDAVNVVPTKGR